MQATLLRLRRLRQTRRPRAGVPSPVAEARADRRAAATLCACLLLAQTLLWLSLRGVDTAGRALWQAAAAQLAPLLTLHLLWRWVLRRALPMASRGLTRARRFAMLTLPSLLLLPCLWLDGGLLMLSLSALSQQTLLPTASWHGCGLLALLFAWAGASLGGARGVPCAATLLQGALLIALFLCTALAGLSPGLGGLYPLGGYGIAASGTAALGLSGFTWVAGLYGLLTLCGAARRNCGEASEGAAAGEGGPGGGGRDVSRETSSEGCSIGTMSAVSANRTKQNAQSHASSAGNVSAAINTPDVALSGGKGRDVSRGTLRQGGTADALTANHVKQYAQYHVPSAGNGSAAINAPDAAVSGGKGRDVSRGTLRQGGTAGALTENHATQNAQYHVSSAGNVSATINAPDVAVSGGGGRDVSRETLQQGGTANTLSANHAMQCAQSHAPSAGNGSAAINAPDVAVSGGKGRNVSRETLRQGDTADALTANHVKQYAQYHVPSAGNGSAAINAPDVAVSGGKGRDVSRGTLQQGGTANTLSANHAMQNAQYHAPSAGNASAAINAPDVAVSGGKGRDFSRGTLRQSGTTGALTANHAKQYAQSHAPSAGNGSAAINAPDVAVSGGKGRDVSRETLRQGGTANTVSANHAMQNAQYHAPSAGNASAAINAPDVAVSGGKGKDVSRGTLRQGGTVGALTANHAKQYAQYHVPSAGNGSATINAPDVAVSGGKGRNVSRETLRTSNAPSSPTPKDGGISASCKSSGKSRNLSQLSAKDSGRVLVRKIAENGVSSASLSSGKGIIVPRETLPNDNLSSARISSAKAQLVPRETISKRNASSARISDGKGKNVSRETLQMSNAPRISGQTAAFRPAAPSAASAAPALLQADAPAQASHAPGVLAAPPSPLLGVDARALPVLMLGWLAGLWYAAFLCLCQPWRPGAMAERTRLLALTRAASVPLLQNTFPLLLALLCGLSLCGVAWAAPGLFLRWERGASRTPVPGMEAIRKPVQATRRDAPPVQPSAPRERAMPRTLARALLGLLALAPCAALLWLPPNATLAWLCDLSWIRWPLAALAGVTALIASIGGRRRG